eukprot:TRINITY_DN3086_c0_g1_i1.p1 TRINITY_DN3086_c0_g1~~TRINITY_DN3086_c0_g1_i1.p1  ORF type:complete len:393 (-),score=116.52 TRINITY_DN3086_c0_g1_i1:183-1361(-)
MSLFNMKTTQLGDNSVQKFYQDNDGNIGGSDREHPSRFILCRNVHSNLEFEELANIFASFGDLRDIVIDFLNDGDILVNYWDLRHSIAAYNDILTNENFWKDPSISVKPHYVIPRSKDLNYVDAPDYNYGTLVIFNLNMNISDEELKEHFEKFGEIKEIRHTPKKAHHRFIEFFDVRAAENARVTLNKTIVKGRKIKIEASRPGGQRSRQFFKSKTSYSRSSTPSSNVSSTSSTPINTPTQKKHNFTFVSMEEIETMNFDVNQQQQKSEKHENQEKNQLIGRTGQENFDNMVYSADYIDSFKSFNTFSSSNAIQTFSTETQNPSKNPSKDLDFNLVFEDDYADDFNTFASEVTGRNTSGNGSFINSVVSAPAAFFNSDSLGSYLEGSLPMVL